MGIGMVATMVGRPLAYDEQTFNSTRLGYAYFCVKSDASLPVVHSFQLKLSMDLIIVMVKYNWKSWACDTCKVFRHSCKASIEAPNLFVNDICKIKMRVMLCMLVAPYLILLMGLHPLQMCCYNKINILDIQFYKNLLTSSNLLGTGPPIGQDKSLTI